MRSLLFAPGDSRKKLDKALQAGADALILDLEDSVDPANKDGARKITHDFLVEQANNEKTPPLFVRINDLESPFWQADVELILSAKPMGLVLPKARGGEDVHRLSVALDDMESRAEIEPGACKLIVIATEVPLALLQMASFAGSSARLIGLTWGAEDLSAAIGARQNRDDDGNHTSPYKLARDLCLITAAAAGVDALDGVFTNFRDLDGLKREARAASRDGFTGKIAIHPSQVPVINAAFTPSDDEISRARSIIDAFDEAGNSGVVALNGEMLDRPHLTRAERILKRAKSAGVA